METLKVKKIQLVRIIKIRARPLQLDINICKLYSMNEEFLVDNRVVLGKKVY